MEKGNLSPVVYERSIKKRMIVSERKHVLSGLLSTYVVANTKCGINNAILALASEAIIQRRDIKNIEVNIFFPMVESLKFSFETELRQYVDWLNECMKNVDFPIKQIKSSMVGQVREPLIQLIANVEEMSVQEPLTNGHIYMIGRLAMGGTLLLAEGARKQLNKRFVPEYISERLEEIKALQLDNMENLKKCSILKRTALAMDGEGGFYSCLWNVANEHQIGLEIDLRSVLVEQITIEICEHLRYNPYYLYGGGAILILTDAEDFLEVCQKNTINAHKIGTYAKNQASQISYDGVKRYLDLPQTDEYWRFVRDERKDFSTT